MPAIAKWRMWMWLSEGWATLGNGEKPRSLTHSRPEEASSAVPSARELVNQLRVTPSETDFLKTLPQISLSIPMIGHSEGASPVMAY
ncbi:hypothetical protein T265_12380 [Opisthorchis viverrini]|uniref:Uncharacterized protein n=1 Tax=Opisthorchis viverrini TaxID=6198 RepID=A0A074YY27_OPIVI|nr:hypothetical protein T265_12380 [Opisthorchis viverrini]KER18092.1 hypothetical protein T265_12380 [Opisthorchis viverrini]